MQLPLRYGASLNIYNNMKNMLPITLSYKTYLNNQSGKSKNSFVFLYHTTLNNDTDCVYFEIIRRAGYNEKLFRTDLKKLFRQIGVENKKTVFFFNADQVRYLD